MNTALVVLALSCIGAVVYSYLVYPFVLIALSTLVQLRRDLAYVLGKRERRRAPAAELPSVSVLISAFNEEACIRERIDNLLQVDYPADRLEILIGSDGSRDRTAAIMAQFDDPRLHCLPFADNRGKASVLNELASRARHPILVFSDANTLFERDALKVLVRHFEDPVVGGVSGELRLSGRGGDNQDGLYWRTEQLLKFHENRIGGLLGANGAIYGIRRSLWTPLAPDTLCDDFCVAMGVAASGSRLVYEPAARAHEEMPQRIAEEYTRRVRIGIGNFQSLVRHPEYLLRTGAATGFAYFSHKILRWLSPHLLIVGLLASLVLALQSPAWLAFAMVQLLGYALAAMAWALTRRSYPLPGLVRIPAFLFALNWAFLVASLRFLGSRSTGTWARTAR